MKELVFQFFQHVTAVEFGDLAGQKYNFGTKYFLQRSHRIPLLLRAPTPALGRAKLDFPALPAHTGDTMNPTKTKTRVTIEIEPADKLLLVQEQARRLHAGNRVSLDTVIVDAARQAYNNPLRVGSPRYFVVVFGDPGMHGDPVDSGVYTSGVGYPPFTASPGDLLLLYCTEEYPGFPKQAPGIGVAFRTQSTSIEYRWIPFATPISRDEIGATFASGDYDKMRQLGIKARRVFDVSRESFNATVAGRQFAWEKS